VGLDGWVMASPWVTVAGGDKFDLNLLGKFTEKILSKLSVELLMELRGNIPTHRTEGVGR
jgi:hypothetical protein